MKKQIIRHCCYLLAYTFIIVLMTACGGMSRPLNENRIAEIIPDRITNGMTVTNVSIDRRQTDGREDTVYAIITMEDGSVQRTAYYILNINYYDVGGWMIDGFRSYQSSHAIPIAPPSDDIAFDAVRSRYSGYTISLISADTSGFQHGHVTFEFEVERERDLLLSTGNVVVSGHFNENWGQWNTSIISETMQQQWVLDSLTGIWEANWRCPTGGPAITKDFTMNITQITDTHIQANGVITEEILNLPGRGFEIPFSGNFQIRFEESQVYFTPISGFQIRNPAGVTPAYRTLNYHIMIDGSGIARIAYGNTWGRYRSREGNMQHRERLNRVTE